MTPESLALHLPVVATILIPLVAAVVGLGVARRGPAVDVALFAGFLAFVSAAYRLVVLPETAPGDGSLGTFSSGLPALSLGELSIPFELAVSARTALLSLVVAGVTLAVLAFAAWYLREDDRRGVFLATVSLFAAAMQLVVHSADLVLTLVGWEVMGFCSYLLIGHWSRTERARRAAYKSFVVTRLADVGFVLGVVILASGARSTGYAQVLEHWSQHAGTALTVAMACLVVAVLGKSAQVPFQDWLPDAMAGPTPASALIHAATMVAAGTVVLAQLAPLLALATGAQWLLAVSVSVTMLLGAALAFGQSDLKALLAWSTVSQVAIMLAPLAVLGAVVDAGAAALFHLYAHALFKALLFLTLGWLSLSIHSTLADRLQGTARRRLSQAAVVVGLAALAGLPLVVGGWSKELVLAIVAGEAGAVGARGWLVLAALLVTVVLTALYATRAALILLRPSASTRSAAAAALAEEDLSTGELRVLRATRAAQREAARSGGGGPPGPPRARRPGPPTPRRCRRVSSSRRSPSRPRSGVCCSWDSSGYSASKPTCRCSGCRSRSCSRSPASRSAGGSAAPATPPCCSGRARRSSTADSASTGSTSRSSPRRCSPSPAASPPWTAGSSTRRCGRSPAVPCAGPNRPATATRPARSPRCRWSASASSSCSPWP
jgi:NADH-quinone oxidoreductase subunit L